MTNDSSLFTVTTSSVDTSGSMFMWTDPITINPLNHWVSKRPKYLFVNTIGTTYVPDRSKSFSENLHYVRNCRSLTPITSRVYLKKSIPLESIAVNIQELDRAYIKNVELL